MKKIKTAEEYFKQFDTTEYPENYKLGDMCKAIKVAQLEMLEYAVNKCAENGKAKLEYPRYDDEDYDCYIDKQSILKTIDEIKKEMNKNEKK